MRPGWYYVWFYAFSACTGYRNIALIDLGVTAGELSALATLSSIIGLLISPIKARYADNLVSKGQTFGREHTIVVSLLLSLFAFILSLLYDYVPVCSPLAFYGSIYILDELCMSAIHPLTRSIVLGKLHDSSKYSVERVFASVSWGISNGKPSIA